MVEGAAPNGRCPLSLSLKLNLRKKQNKIDAGGREKRKEERERLA
jgi:hypothetical protein